MPTCKSCGAEIEFIRTKAGRLAPVNQKRITIVTNSGDVISGRQSHFASCPGASEHRKPKEKPES